MKLKTQDLTPYLEKYAGFHYNKFMLRNKYHLIVLLSILLICFCGNLPALDPNKATTQYVHEYWTADQRLPQNSVISILQSRNGYLWLGMEQGLIRFDGVRFTVYDMGIIPEMKSNMIWHLHEGRDGSLWISTHNGGVTRMKNGKWTTYTTEETLSENFVRAVYEDAEGSVWIATRDGGLNRLKDGKITVYTTRDGLSRNKIRCLAGDSQGNLWIGTYDNGLNRMRGGEVTVFTVNDGLSSNNINTLYINKKDILWIGTDKGFNRFQDGKFTAFTTKDGLSSNAVSAILEDKDGNLWIGTDGGGVNRFYKGKFSYFSSKEGLLETIISCFYEDKEGSLWIGTKGGGLYRLRDGKFISFSTKEGLPFDSTTTVYMDSHDNFWIGTTEGLHRLYKGAVTTFTLKEGLSNLKIWSVLEDKNGILWIGTAYGLNRFYNGKFTVFTKEDGLSDNAVWFIHEDKKGDLWLATNAGVNIMHEGKITLLPSNEKLSKAIVLSIVEDAEGIYWFGTDGGGLIKLHDSKFTNFTTKDGLSIDSIWSLHADKEGNLWIGTLGGGLNLYRDGKFTTFTRKDGLFDDTIFCILEDSSGNLWMSSNRGVFRVSKNELVEYSQNKVLLIHSTAYGKADGMRSQECNGGFQHAGWKDKDGKLWFSTTAGAVMIDPEHITINEQPPPLVIEEVIVDGKAINQATKLILEPGLEQLEIHYTALSFNVPERVLFRYRMEGYDHNWQEAGTRRVAYYTNLSPGHYIFNVQACNDDGAWNTAGASYYLYLKPHFYQAWWFYALCALAAAAIAYGIYRLRVRQLKLRQQQLWNLVHERTQQLQERTQQLKEMDELKTRFFSNISHELRTPLTLIIGPLENLLNEFLGATEKGMKSRAASGQLEMMLRNARRLLRLINQLLDISKLEAGKMELNACAGNIVKFVRETCSLFESLARRKNIDLQFQPEKEHIELYFDPEKMEKILYNLLSNAFKFTQDNGKVMASISELPDSVEIIIKDTGSGIPKDELPYIFDRFRQVAGSSSKMQEGTGIGLSLVKDLVTLHHGEIEVKSEPGWGSEFILHFKPGKEHLAASEITDETLQEIPSQSSLDAISESDLLAPPVQPESEAIIIPSIEPPEAEALVLIVDDNTDVRNYIRNILQERYRILEARDGEEGFNMALEHLPDIILSDIMMPKLDGYGLLKLVRAEEKTSHIPVILLTARASEEMRVEGLEKGADDYMPKPFNARELLARVRNLIILRQQERELKRFNTELEQKVREQLDALLRSTRLAQYLPPKLVDKILSSEEELITYRKKLTIVFTDLRGFSDISDRDEPERINNLLNDYLTEMVALINQHGGTLGRFMGDGIMAFFGAPDDMPEKEQAKNAVSMAVAMQQKMKELSDKWLSEGLDHDLKIRIGINQDYVTVGNFGSKELKEYTVIGKGVNLASRLENACTPGKIMVSFQVYSLTRDDFPYDPLQEREFKGFARAVKVCEL